MSVLPTFLIAGACGLAIAYLIYREWRGMRREDCEWARELAAAKREDDRIARRDTQHASLEALWKLPTRDPEHSR